LDPQQRFEHEARQFKCVCGKLATRFGSPSINPGGRFSGFLLRGFAHGLRRNPHALVDLTARASQVFLAEQSQRKRAHDA
jgi:hypothetical protein